ncbi:TIGR03985 family CRISPR-associated protein [Phormidesmis priestleyi]
MPSFDHLPTVELLTAFARGSLRQDLARAVRLWVILSSVYGDFGLCLSKQFTYNQWRDAFFTQTQKGRSNEVVYHQRDEVPPMHDPHCRCAKTLMDWLFDSEIGSNRSAWCAAFLQLYPMSQLELENLLQTGKLDSKDERKQTGRQSLLEGRLFAVTGKQLQYDFRDLIEMGWLEKASEKGQAIAFHKVCRFPEQCVSPALTNSIALDLRNAVSNVIETDAIDLFEHLGQPIRGVQRLFLDIEYIVPGRLSERVSDLQQTLKQIWQTDPVPPVCLTYRSARLYDEIQDFIVYPVCVRYFQRAPYLFAFGRNPKSLDRSNWYDFRLDRIDNLEVLTWDDRQIKAELRDRCLGENPPSPDEVRERMSEAWGFDIYNPQDTLLLRFDQYFHAHYVANTERAALLTAISSRVAERMVSGSNLERSQQHALIEVIKRKPKDIYCRVKYRTEDNNVVMRLRAWGANVEVLLPWELRSRMAKDMQKTWGLYKNVLD